MSVADLRGRPSEASNVLKVTPRHPVHALDAYDGWFESPNLADLPTAKSLIWPSTFLQQPLSSRLGPPSEATSEVVGGPMHRGLPRRNVRPLASR